MNKLAKFFSLIVIGTAASFTAQAFEADMDQDLAHLFKTGQHRTETELKKSSVTIYAEVTRLSKTGKLLDVFLPRTVVSSGGVINENGQILTTAHGVIASDEKDTISKIWVKTYTGHRYEAHIGKIDKNIDAALLKIIDPKEKLKAVKFAGTNSFKVNEKVKLVAWDRGKDHSIIEGVAKKITTLNANNSVGECGLGNSTKYLQSEMETFGGASGGFLTNSRGEVIGLHARGSLSNKYGYAVTTDTLFNFMATC